MSVLHPDVESVARERDVGGGGSGKWVVRAGAGPKTWSRGDPDVPRALTLPSVHASGGVMIWDGRSA